MVDRQTGRLSDMVENLINAARFQAGSLAVLPKPTSLAGIINHVATQYDTAINNKGLHFVISVPASITVQADAPRISLVISNLLDNAIKFTSSGGITVQAIAEEKTALISVSDTGIGIDPEVQPRLFDPFYQVEPLLTRKTGGAGLGLLVSKAIVEAHSGRIWVESVPGEGSTFFFTIPLADHTSRNNEPRS